MSATEKEKTEKTSKKPRLTADIFSVEELAALGKYRDAYRKGTATVDERVRFIQKACKDVKALAVKEYTSGEWDQKKAVGHQVTRSRPHGLTSPS